MTPEGELGENGFPPNKIKRRKDVYLESIYPILSPSERTKDSWLHQELSSEINTSVQDFGDFVASHLLWKQNT